MEGVVFGPGQVRLMGGDCSPLVWYGDSKLHL